MAVVGEVGEVEVVVVVVRREAPDQARFGIERVRQGEARLSSSRSGGGGGGVWR